MSSEHSINGFMIACGMTGPLELEVEDRRQGTVERRVYHQPYVLIGRSLTSDLPLDDDQVSRRHAYLQVVAGRLYCLDLASRTGIHWEDGTFGSGSLNYTNGLKVGPFVIRLREGLPAPAGTSKEQSADNKEPDAPDLRPRRLPRVTLVFGGEPTPQPPWRINRMLTLVGRSPLCRVLLSGSEVSRFHCSLIRTPIGVWVVDLQGRTGTSVNSRPTRCRLLGDGDELEVGSNRIQLRYGRYADAERQEPPDPPLNAPAPVVSIPASMPAWPAELPTTAAASSFLMPSAGLPAVPGFSMPASGWSPMTNLMEVRSLLEGRPPEQVELAETLLVPVIHQFGQMQMHMFDQFQQMLMMMFQMFSTMHREQMDVVREELGQIRHLTQELQETQAELRKQTAPAQASPSARSAATPTLASPAPPRDAKVKAPDWSSTEQRRPPVERPRPPAQDTERLSDTKQARASQPSAAGKRDTVAPPGGDAARNLHAVLAQRIAALQQERQTRWQKLVQMMTGGGGASGKPATGPNQDGT